MLQSQKAPDGVAEYLGATEMWLPAMGVRFALYFTKDTMFRWWFRVWEGHAPDEIAVLEHGSTPNKSAASTIHTIGKALRVPIVLFGDLDPGDLAAFATLVSGDPDLHAPRLPAVSFVFGGIDDSLLELAKRHIGSRRFNRECRLRMSAEEKRHLEVIRRVCPPVRDICGPESAHLLDSGYKCEVEAILHPRLCTGTLLDEVRAHFADTLPAGLGL